MSHVRRLGTWYLLSAHWRWELSAKPGFLSSLHPALSDIPQTQRGGIPSLASQRFIDTDTLRKYPSSFSAQWGSAVSRLQADFRQGLSKFRWGLAEYIITLRMCQKYLWLVMISGYCLCSFMYPQSQYSITHIGNPCEEQGAQNHALRWCPNRAPHHPNTCLAIKNS